MDFSSNVEISTLLFHYKHLQISVLWHTGEHWHSRKDKMFGHFKHCYASENECFGESFCDIKMINVWSSKHLQKDWIWLINVSFYVIFYIFHVYCLCDTPEPSQSDKKRLHFSSGAGTEAYHIDKLHYGEYMHHSRLCRTYCVLPSVKKNRVTCSPTGKELPACGSVFTAAACWEHRHRGINVWLTKLQSQH